MVQCPWSHNARRPVQFGLVCCTIVAATPGSATCLSDAIPASSRKLVGLVDSYPLGMWVNDWPAGHAVAEMMAIIIQEVMGYEVEMKGPGAGTVNGFFALAGCRKPMDSQDPDCDGVTRTLVHMNVEGWTEGYTPTWQMIQDKYPSMPPRNLGNAGYFGDARAHISTPVQEMAYNAEGLSLDFYRELNASWNDVKRYFADLDSVDKSRLRFCNGTLLMDPVEMGIYAEMTGDLDGVVFEGAGGSVVAKCWQNHFWYAPACRQSPSRCWPFITGGSGWQVGDFMQKATAFNFAAAVAVAKNWDNYVSLPTDHASIFYWWVPDTTFLRMKPQAVTFPAYDRIAWERGDKKTGSKQMSVDIHVSQDLAALAPSVQQLLAASSLTIKDVNDVMLDTLDSGITYRDAVCRWLNAKTERWRKWLPDKTLCVAGFGLYDISADVFVQSRSGDTANIECRVCPSGHFSDRLQDDKGAEARADALEQEVDALNRKLKLLEADLDTAEDKAADQTDKVKELEAQNEELLRENKQLQRRVDVLEDEQDEGKFDQLKQKLSTAEGEIEELQRSKKQLERQIDVLEEDLEKAEGKYEDAKKELETTLAELGEM